MTILNHIIIVLILTLMDDIDYFISDTGNTSTMQIVSDNMGNIMQIVS